MTAPAPDPLTWHQARRDGGVPTVSVLAGPVGLGVRAWRAWAADTTRPVAQSPVGPPESVAAAWAAAAFAAADPANLAAAWLHARVRPPPDLGRMTRYDLDQLWRTLPADPTAPASAAAHWLLAGRLNGTAADPAAFVRGVAVAAPGRPAEWGRVYRAVCDLSPPPPFPPALLVLPPAAATPGWFARLLRELEAVVAAVPSLPVAVAVPREDFDALLAAEPNTRVAALAREGLVEVRGVSAADLAARLAAAGVAPPPSAATLQSLTADGLADEAAAAYVAAAKAVRERDPADPFRSEPERFLFEKLESTPETAGLFRPNVRLPFAHGPRAAEADLLAAGLKLVVEIDGGYYHLTEAQYRRDREKDWLYQRHAYWVLRFLAEDVVDRTAAVLGAILTAVAARRPAPPPPA